MADNDTDQIIDYDALTREALRGVAKKVLSDIEKHGLPGEHHLFISFDTRADGVIISKRLREEYPSEMTVVLQHRFWDLEIHEDHFQVKLTFNAIPERLIIPFMSLKVFYDPSVPYGLQFSASEMKVESVGRSPVLSDATNRTDLPDRTPLTHDFSQPPLEYLAGKMPNLSTDTDTDTSINIKEITELVDADNFELIDDEAIDVISEENADETETEERKKPATAEIVELDQFRKR